MDEDLIKLVNKLQDTFSNLGARPGLASIASLSALCSTLPLPRHVWHLQVGNWTCPNWLWYAGIAPLTPSPCPWNDSFVGRQPIRRQIQRTRKVSESLPPFPL